MTEACCPSTSWGPLLTTAYDSKTPGQGELLTIGSDLEVYLKKPSTSECEKAIIVFTDVWGLQSRLFGICDHLSEHLNSVVIALDCFRGETKGSYSDPEDFKDWLRRYPFEEKAGESYSVKRDIECAIDYLTLEFKTEKFSAIGFCWGVWALTKACAEGIDFKCGVGFHPSIKLEEIVSGSACSHVDMAAKACAATPLLYLVAGNDMDNLKPPEGEVAKLIESSFHEPRGNNIAPRCEVFPDMIHGWVSRGDTSQEKVKEDAERALKLGTDFISAWM